MLRTVTVVILLSQLPCEVITSGTNAQHTPNLPSEGCEPNKQFFVNGLSCACDSSGRWQQSDCQAVQRGQDCQPGGVIQIGCSQCVCQGNRHLFCDDRVCTEGVVYNGRRGLDVIGQWCTPFKSYYVDCSICVCSASGKTSDAQCVKDTACSLNESTAVKTGEKNICLPKVTYLFPCLHCLCSEHGHFELDKCVEICQKEPMELVARCKPRKLYRKECNLCICPDNGIENDLLCSKNPCPNVVRSKSFRYLQEKVEACLLHSFTPKRCIYCECTTDGNIDEDACIEAECLKHNSVNYGISKTSCTSGEMVPLCSECFCLSNGTTSEEYCTRSCSYQSKRTILEKVVQDSSKDKPLINRDKVKKLTTKQCQPNLVYIKDEKYCLCSDKRVISEELCTIQKERVDLQAGLHKNQFYNFNVTCEPSTFVEFDCNTCFCSKNGTIDPKWCTYDDCERKKLIRESHKLKEKTTSSRSFNGTCIPGTISKEECNFCICSETGLLKDRACTKNHCSDVDSAGSATDKFSCEPLSYYEVDCNICYCPRDGLKNVSNCTKHTCEKTFLRSNVCIPGQLFSDECDVCICPPNGDKNDKACTNNSCSETTWKKEFRMSLPISNQIVNEIRISLDHCFPGEEYFVGCKLCVCPDMGLRSYAICNQMLCANEPVFEGSTELEQVADSKYFSSHVRRHFENERCTHYELLDLPDNSPPCTKGTTYIVNCKQCLCPSDDGGSILGFCRPLPDEFKCNRDSNVTSPAQGLHRRQLTNTTSTGDKAVHEQMVVDHPHTTYPCPKPGRVMDECFICECEEKQHVIVQEHCYKSVAEKCEEALATFLLSSNKHLQI